MKRILVRLREGIDIKEINDYLINLDSDVDLKKRRSVLLSQQAYVKLEGIATSNHISMSAAFLLVAINMFVAKGELFNRNNNTIEDAAREFKKIVEETQREKEEKIRYFKNELLKANNALGEANRKLEPLAREKNAIKTELKDIRDIYRKKIEAFKWSIQNLIDKSSQRTELIDIRGKFDDIFNEVRWK